ncbi:MAG: excinuclease ABC subunit UvrA, partial [Methylococcales bacterium]|nr:excinuclease ABC subunit UvrA [Methylococcales bacterium]
DQVLTQDKKQRWMLLAPVVNQRKGEHLKLFNELRAQGFIRARVNGELYELESPPTLDLHKKHTIEVVIDRFKIRQDLRVRLTESFETALRIANGLAIVMPLESNSQAKLVFSNKYACPKCGYSLSELEPRIFSFNNPKGACPDCEGLGVTQHFEAELVISDASLSLAKGAIRGWSEQNHYYFQMLSTVATQYGFSVREPFSKISKKNQAIILHGSGDVSLDFELKTDTGKVFAQSRPFEGIIENMKRRYHETDSQKVREELSKYLAQKTCHSCAGERLNIAARHVFIRDMPLPKLSQLSIANALDFFKNLTLDGHKGQVADKINKEIQTRLEFLVNVGLNYLSLDRSADTLSGGEAQRIRLASQIGAGLVGVMYVLDEPSIGLHQRDNQRLLNTLFRLRDLGNTVIMVEHDEEAIRAADYIVDIGVGAGIHGGAIVAQGSVDDIIKEKASLTGQYLSKQQTIAIPKRLVKRDKNKQIIVRKASGHNLKKIDVQFPIGLLTCVTGVSGSGKSTLVNETLYHTIARVLNKSTLKAAPCEAIEGLEHLDKVININQSPIGRTPRSNPATYTGIFTPIRELFAATPEARSRGYTPGRFSFNIKGGRCETCRGDGLIKVEMHFLPDVFVPCDQCKRQRYNRETLDIQYKGKNIHEILTLTVEDAYPFFKAIPVLEKKLKTLMEVGLSYLTLGQNAVTLSGGEAQRVKLAKELSKRDTGKTLYILDEPTTGLHFHDIKQLLAVLHTLRDHGNTIIVIEHNLDVIKTADWVIDMGPEGGDSGGFLVEKGTPKQLAKHPSSYTG